MSEIIKLDEKGLLAFNDHNDLKKAALYAISTGLAPESLVKEGPQAVAAALMVCKQYGLPQKAMGQMGYIHGRITCFGSLVTALAERHPDYGEHKVVYINEAGKEISLDNNNLQEEVWGCVILSKKKGEAEWKEFSFTKRDAEQAGLLNPTKNEYVNGKRTGKRIPNADSPWVKYTKDMLYHKANKRRVETQYSSALEGISYHEDLVGVFKEEIKDVTPMKSDVMEKVQNPQEVISYEEA